RREPRAAQIAAGEDALRERRAGEAGAAQVHLFEDPAGQACAAQIEPGEALVSDGLAAPDPRLELASVDRHHTLSFCLRGRCRTRVTSAPSSEGARSAWTSARSAEKRLLPFRFAARRSAPCSTANIRFAPRRSASRRSASVASARFITAR